MPIPVAGNLGHLALPINRFAHPGGHIEAEKESPRIAVRQPHEQVQRFTANRAGAHKGKLRLPIVEKEVQLRKAVKHRAILRDVHTIQRTVQLIESIERVSFVKKQVDEGGVLLQPIRNGLVPGDAVEAQQLCGNALAFGAGIAKRQRRDLPGFQIELIQAFGGGEQIRRVICRHRAKDFHAALWTLNFRNSEVFRQRGRAQNADQNKRKK